jgi:hypothetical protein
MDRFIQTCFASPEEQKKYTQKPSLLTNLTRNDITAFSRSSGADNEHNIEACYQVLKPMGYLTEKAVPPTPIKPKPAPNKGKTTPASKAEPAKKDDGWFCTSGLTQGLLCGGVLAAI